MILKAEEADVKSCENSINERVAKNIAKFAVPGQFDDRRLDLCNFKVIRGQIFILARIYVVQNLPKTRSGKVMRRLLRKLSLNETELGDTSTLVDPSALDHIRSVMKYTS